MKKEKNKHGEAGRGQGRKPTGRVRNFKLNGALFTEDERSEIIAKAKASNMKQYEFILKAVQNYEEMEK